MGDAAKRYPSRLKSVEHRLLVIEVLLVVPLLYKFAERLYYKATRRRILKWAGYNLREERIFVNWKDIVERAGFAGAFAAAGVLLADSANLMSVALWKAAGVAGFAAALSVLKNYYKQWKALPKEPTEATPIADSS
jgi:hypothetical protein